MTALRPSVSRPLRDLILAWFTGLTFIAFTGFAAYALLTGDWHSSAYAATAIAAAALCRVSVLELRIRARDQQLDVEVQKLARLADELQKIVDRAHR